MKVRKKKEVMKMVNEKQGKEYTPKPVYNRKLVRTMIRAGIIKKFGNHKVSKNMSLNFKEIRGIDT